MCDQCNERNQAKQTERPATLSATHAEPYGQRRSDLHKAAVATGMGQLLSPEEIVAELFRYHSPSAEQLPRYMAVRTAAKNMAEIILQNVPAGADRTAAIRKLRECVFTANSGIALNGLSL